MRNQSKVELLNNLWPSLKVICSKKVGLRDNLLINNSELLHVVVSMFIPNRFEWFILSLL